ncbi:MAG: hypothetical protein E6I91_13640 [Chloroflexi bacterium]|nr:MAG: hypothetical protein E6I91_13640 [Chloroflexota bacterium]
MDYVSQAIVALAQREDSVGQAFHLFNPATISVGELIDYANAFGYKVQQVDYDTWVDELAGVTEGVTDNALAPLAPLFPKKGRAGQPGQVLNRAFGNGNVLAGLAGTSITCPLADQKLLSAYFSYLIQSGFLPAPQSVNEH